MKVDALIAGFVFSALAALLVRAAFSQPRPGTHRAPSRPAGGPVRRYSTKARPRGTGGCCTGSATPTSRPS
jgi:hypothetical protein